MPQLDRIIIFPQIFWFFIVLIIFYILLIHYFLPKFLSSLKSRKYLLQKNIGIVLKITNRLNSDHTNLVKNLNLNFKEIKQSIYLNSNDIQLLFLNSKFVNPIQLDEYIIKIIKQNILFCNKQIFKNIQIYPYSLNFKN